MMYFLAPLSAAFVIVALSTALLVRRDRRLAHRCPKGEATGRPGL